MGDIEHVVLLDEQGRATGTTPKAGVHHADTPLHLAFSCYALDASGERLLLTRRALNKPTWPGVWTNSVCGHPAEGEDLRDAVRRRAADELGATLSAPVLLLPTFRYRAVMADGTVENEMCPVFAARIEGDVAPDPAEVDDHRWVDWAGFRASVLDGEADVSPWCVEQVRALPEHLGEHLDGPGVDPGALPPAARWA